MPDEKTGRPDEQYVVQMKGITKVYPNGVAANQGVDFNLRKGEIHALMSENGAEFEATLDETGAYKFDAVMPGRYYVRYELPEDTVFASVQNGGNAVTGEQGVGASEWFDFATAQQKDMPLVGGVTLGRVNGVTFEDHDGSGTRDDGDALLAGAVILCQ